MVDAKKWIDGHEAKTMADGLELAELVFERLGLKARSWEDSVGLVSPWKYTNVPFDSGEQVLRVGVSSGGVVSVDRDPFTPGDRQMNVTLAAVERSVSSRIETVLRLSGEQREASDAWLARQALGVASNEALGRVVAPLVGAKLEADDEVGFVLTPDLKHFPMQGIASSTEAGAFAELGRIARDAWSEPEHRLHKVMSNEVLNAVRQHVLTENVEQAGQPKASPVEIEEQSSERQKSMSSTNPYDPKHREPMYARFTLENGSSLEAPELERIYGSAALPDFCIKFMQAERADGVTVEGIYEALGIRHHMGRGQDEREFLDTLIRESSMEPADAVALSDKLQVLSAAHLKLNTMDHNEGLSSDQSAARDEIEERVRSLVANVEGIDEPTFSYDGRGPAVRLVFDSGIGNSFSAGWIVPLKDNAAGGLTDDFWQQYVPTTPQSELVDVLVQSGNDREVVSEQVERLVLLAAQHTKMAVELSEIDGDLAHDDGFVQVNGDLRNQIRALAGEINGVSGVEFGMDSRYSTVVLNLESGRHNRMSGGWSVPVDDERLDAVEQDFWRDMVSEDEAEADDEARFVVLSITNTDNAAFVDLGRDQEIARIMREAGERLAGLSKVDDAEFPLRDVNGNRVGQVYVSETAASEPPAGTVALSVRIPGAEEDEEPGQAVADLAKRVHEAAVKIDAGDNIFVLRDDNGNMVGRFEFREAPSIEKDGVIDMNAALLSGRVYLAEDSFSGIADGEYRYVVTSEDFEPGYGQAEGDVWLVNAKGETAPGYEEPQTVREVLFSELKGDHKSDLLAVVEGRMAFDDFERKLSGDTPEPA